MCHWLISETLIQILIWRLFLCQGQLHTELKLKKAVNCDTAGLQWFIKNFTVHHQDPLIYVNGHLEVTEDVKIMNNIYIHVERCTDQWYDCEDFQSWNIDHLCQMLNWNNQYWSKVVSHIHPRIRCPVKKMNYELRNGTLDVRPLMKWYPDMNKYRWKVLCKINNDSGTTLFCSHFELFLHQYRIQQRSGERPPKKPRYVR